jgi:DNA-binding NarL/FixJ family response regulator
MHSGILSEYLNCREDLEVVGTTERTDDVRSLAARSSPDIVVLDRVLPRGHAFVDDTVTGALRFPTVLLCGSCAEEQEYNRPPSARNRVAVSACRAPESLIEAIRALHRSEPFISPAPEHSDCLSETFRRDRGLTRRELVVLSMAAGGLTSRDIAKELGVSHRTVENHRQRIRNKLGIHDKAALVHEAEKIGLVR